MEKHISWLAPEEEALEKKIWAEFANDEVQKHLEYLATLTRFAGSEDELKAAHYIDGKLKEYGLDSEIYELEGYVSYPGEAEFTIISPVQKSFPCLAHGFIGPTPPAGMEGEIISLGKGLEKDYEGVDVKGKIVVIEPVSGPGDHVDAAERAELKGAKAQIHITSGIERAIKVMQMKRVWGNPTPDTIDKLPKIPAISICNEDGIELLELIKQGGVIARLKANASRGYKRICQPIGTLKGVDEPEKYVLYGAHYCSWYLGAMDNAGANALLLEVARIFAKYRKSLRRSVRFAWWTGHTHGTYAGSTWYVDNFWDDMRRNAIAYVNMDSIGRVGSSAGFNDLRNTEEMKKFGQAIVKRVLGEEVKSVRIPKVGEQSFLGLGLPSMTGNTTFTAEQTKAVRGGPQWYLHTEKDTVDKVDVNLISIPFRVFATSILRLCNNPVFPFEFVTVADTIKNRLDDLAGSSGSAVNLLSLKTQVEELGKKAEMLNKAIEKNLLVLEEKKKTAGLEDKFREINASLMRLSRTLTPILYTRAGKYGQDPMGAKLKPVPVLQALEELASMDSNSDEYRALQTLLSKERNKVSDALDSALGILNDALSRV